MPFKFHASRRHKIPKARYAVKNWPAYEAALRQRGDIWIWIGDDVEAHWTVPGKRTPSKLLNHLLTLEQSRRAIPSSADVRPTPTVRSTV